MAKAAKGRIARMKRSLMGKDPQPPTKLTPKAAAMKNTSAVNHLANAMASAGQSSELSANSLRMLAGQFAYGGSVTGRALHIPTVRTNDEVIRSTPDTLLALENADYSEIERRMAAEIAQLVEDDLINGTLEQDQVWPSQFERRRLPSAEQSRVRFQEQSHNTQWDMVFGIDRASGPDMAGIAQAMSRGRVTADEFNNQPVVGSEEFEEPATIERKPRTYKRKIRVRKK